MKSQKLTFKQISDQKFDECIKEEFPLSKISNFSRAFRRTYPNLQYSCTKCGTLDVTLDLKNPDFIVLQCLDCKSKWMEEYEN